MKADTLKRVLRMRFEEMKRYRELELERGGANEQYATDVCLPDVILAVLKEYVDVREHGHRRCFVGIARARLLPIHDLPAPCAQEPAARMRENHDARRARAAHATRQARRSHHCGRAVSDDRP
jgi:hypothetical protein